MAMLLPRIRDINWDSLGGGNDEKDLLFYWNSRIMVGCFQVPCCVLSSSAEKICQIIPRMTFWIKEYTISFVALNFCNKRTSWVLYLSHL